MLIKKKINQVSYIEFILYTFYIFIFDKEIYLRHKDLRTIFCDQCPHNQTPTVTPQNDFLQILRFWGGFCKEIRALSTPDNEYFWWLVFLQIYSHGDTRHLIVSKYWNFQGNFLTIYIQKWTTRNKNNVRSIFYCRVYLLE